MALDRHGRRIKTTNCLDLPALHCNGQMMNDGRDQKRNGNFLSASAGVVGLCITEEELAWLKGRTHLKGEYLAVFFISYICIRMHVRTILLVSFRKNKLCWNISFQNTAHNLFQNQLSHWNLTYDKSIKWNTVCSNLGWKLGSISADLTHTHTIPASQWVHCHFLGWRLSFHCLE